MCMTAKIDKESFKRMVELLKKHTEFKNIKGPIEVDRENGIVKIGGLLAPIQVVEELLEHVRS